MRGTVSLAAVVVVLTAGCVPIDHPPVLACSTNGGTAVLGSSGGKLRVLPSLVPGVELEKASWRSVAHGIDIGAQDDIDYTATLRSSRDVPDTDVAIVYELRTRAHQPLLLLDAELVANSPGELEAPSSDASLHQKDVPRERHFISEGHPGFISGIYSSASGCPVAVRVVPRNTLALYMRSGVALADDPEALLESVRRRVTSVGTGPLRVLDVVNKSREFESLVGVVVENSADSVINDMVAAVSMKGGEGADTIELYIPHLGPHAAIARAIEAPFHTVPGVARVYPAGEVRGRLIADREHLYRVSKMPRIGDVIISGARAKVPAGLDYAVSATPVTPHGDVIPGYENLPIQWAVSSENGGVRLDTTTVAASHSPSAALIRRAILRTEHGTRARVTATIAGITGSAEITFLDPPGFVPPGATFDPQGHRVLSDGSIEVQNLCVIHPDGRIVYEPWVVPHLAEVRADSLDRSDAAVKRREALARTLKRCAP